MGRLALRTPCRSGARYTRPACSPHQRVPDGRARCCWPTPSTCRKTASPCSPLGGWAHAHGGWSRTTWAGLRPPMLAPAGFLTERPETHPGGHTMSTHKPDASHSPARAVKTMPASRPDLELPGFEHRFATVDGVRLRGRRSAGKQEGRVAARQQFLRCLCWFMFLKSTRRGANVTMSTRNLIADRKADWPRGITLTYVTRSCLRIRDTRKS
jgi:hypothetical protein